MSQLLRKVSIPGPSDFVDVVDERKLAARPVARPSRAMVRAAPRRKSNKKKRSLTSTRRPLRDVSAKNVSLQDAADFIGAAWKYGRMALSFLNAEEKYLYTAHQDGLLNSAQAYYISAIAEGTDYYQRTGNTIKVKNVRLDYVLTGNATAVTNQARIIVFRDLACQAATPSYADLLVDSATTTTLTITSPYQNFIGERFQVLYDEVHTMSTAGPLILHRRVAFSVDDHVLYKGTGSTVASAWQGALFAFIFADNNTNKVNCTMSSLVTFVDN